VDIATRTYTVTSATPGIGFTTPTLNIQAAGRNFATLVNNVVAVAQEAEFQITASLIAGDVVGVTVAGTGITQNFSGSTTSTLVSLASQITSTTPVNASYSGTTGKVYLKAKVPGNAFSLSHIVTGSSGVASAVVQPNVVPVAQVNTLTLPRSIDPGETLSLTVSGSGITQSYTGSSAVTLEALVAQIDALDIVNATIIGNVVTITAATPGVPFTLSTLEVTGGTGTLVPVQPNVIAVAQVSVLSFNRDFVAGDSFSGSIGASQVQMSFSGSSSATLTALTDAIDALPAVTASSNTALKTITITSATPGMAFVSSNFDIKTDLPSTLISGNVSPVAQSESLTLPRALAS